MKKMILNYNKFPFIKSTIKKNKNKREINIDIDFIHSFHILPLIFNQPLIKLYLSSTMMNYKIKAAERLDLLFVFDERIKSSIVK